MTTISETRLDAARFNNSGLPLALDLAKAIANDARVSFFSTAQVGNYTLVGVPGPTVFDGLVNPWANMKDGATDTLAQATTNKQPAIDLDGGPNGRGAMQFQVANIDAMDATAAFPVAGDWFKIAIFRCDAVTASNYFARSSTSGNRHLFGPVTTGGGSIRHTAGASGTEASVTIAFPLGAWNLVIGCYSATEKQVALSINNGSFQTDKEPALVVDATGATIDVASGSAFGLAAIGWGTCDLTLAANDDLLDLILEFARDICGLDV